MLTVTEKNIFLQKSKVSHELEMFRLLVPTPHFRLTVINLDKEFGCDMELIQINTVCGDFAYVQREILEQWWVPIRRSLLFIPQAGRLWLLGIIPLILLLSTRFHLLSFFRIPLKFLHNLKLSCQLPSCYLSALLAFIFKYLKKDGESWHTPRVQSCLCYMVSRAEQEPNLLSHSLDLAFVLLCWQSYPSVTGFIRRFKHVCNVRVPSLMSTVNELLRNSQMWFIWPIANVCFRKKLVFESTLLSFWLKELQMTN